MAFRKSTINRVVHCLEFISELLLNYSSIWFWGSKQDAEIEYKHKEVELKLI